MRAEPGPVVVDASVALAWVLPGDETERALALRDRAMAAPSLRLLVPPTFWYEVANALWAAVRRRRLGRSAAGDALVSLQDFGVDIWSVAPETCLDLAFHHQVAVYDSAYLALALSVGATLWSLDERLRAAARSSHIGIEP